VLWNVVLATIARDALEQILADGMEQGIVDDAVIAANLSQRAAFWKLRDEMSAAQSRKAARSSTTSRCRSLLSRTLSNRPMPRCVKIDSRARGPGAVRPSRRRQHPLQCQPAGSATDLRISLARWHDVNEVVFRSLSGWAGVDFRRARHRRAQAQGTADVKDKVAIELMRGIKAMLDPLGIMNPGKVL